MYSNILVPVVLGEGHDHDTSFAVARKLAADGARFTVLHVREPIPAYAAAEIPEEVLNRNHQERKASLDAVAAALPGAGTEIVRGQAGRAIVEYAEEKGIDCIVLASHKPGLQNWFLGSTANRVVHHARCAVHVIR